MSDTNILDLDSVDAFAPTTGERVSIKLEDKQGEEKEYDFFVKAQDFKSFSSLIDEKNKDQFANAKLIAISCFRDEKCKLPLMSYDKALELKPAIAMKLIEKILEVNAPKKKGGKKTKSSGTSS